jgi:signal transduction histidine kinase
MSAGYLELDHAAIVIRKTHLPKCKAQGTISFMNPISAYLVENMIAIFFFYGLAFFTLGLALWLASQRESDFKFVRAIRPLALFGLIHGVHEWYEMFQKIAKLDPAYTLGFLEESIRLGTLAVSFYLLGLFGVLLLAPEEKARRWVSFGSIGYLGLWMAAIGLSHAIFRPGFPDGFQLADVVTRYTMGIPAALLAAWALMVQQRTFRLHRLDQFGRDLVWCASAIVLYGAIGQLFVQETVLFPSNYVNSQLFLDWFGIPVQLFRGTMATLLAVFMMRALRAFEIEGQRRLQAANEARLAAQESALAVERRVGLELELLNEKLRQREQTLAELLRQVVNAQETERRRIARELHDATGQSLTAVALGLRGVGQVITQNGEVAQRHLRELERYATNALEELRQIIADLRPSQLDDLGLAAALQWYMREFEAHYAVQTGFVVKGEPRRLPPEYETVLFRIAQEGLNNIAKHAQASRADLRLRYWPQQICLVLDDNGRGFSDDQLQDARAGWGLRGIQERAALLGGRCDIRSAPDHGTRLRVWVPLSDEGRTAKDENQTTND